MSPEPLESNALRTRWLLAGFVALFFVMFVRGHLSGNDELVLYQTTRALAERGDLAIPPIPISHPGAGGHSYCPYALGQAVLALPLYGLGRLAEAVLPAGVVAVLAGPKTMLAEGRWPTGGRATITAVLLYGPLASALLAALFFTLQREFGASSRSALVASVGLMLCSYPALMSNHFLRHTSAAIFLLAGLLFLMRWRRGGERYQLLVGTLFASLTLLVRVPAALAAIPFAFYVLGGLRSRRGGELARDLLAIAAPALVVLAVHAFSNDLRWGSALGAPQVAVNLQHFSHPIGVGLWGFLLSPGMSIFVYSPLLLLSFWTLPGFWRSHRSEALLVVVLSATFLVVFSRYDAWTGLWAAPGPRYLFVPVVFLMLPLGLWLDRWGRLHARRAVAGLATLGFAVQFALLSTSFSHVASLLGYAERKPFLSFLFVPDLDSPIPAAFRFLAAGSFDLLIVGVAAGWSGQAAHPQAALALVIGWLLLTTWLWLSLWQSTQPAFGPREN